jgi:hypothetical protein
VIEIRGTSSLIGACHMTNSRTTLFYICIISIVSSSLLKENSGRSILQTGNAICVIEQILEGIVGLFR